MLFNGASAACAAVFFAVLCVVLASLLVWKWRETDGLAARLAHQEQFQAAQRTGDVTALAEEQRTEVQELVDDATCGRLLALARSGSPKQRQKALETLAEWRPQAAAKVCVERLGQESDAGVLLVLLHVAGQGRVTETAGAVLKHLAEGNVAVRPKAAWALGEMFQGVGGPRPEQARGTWTTTYCVSAPLRTL